MKTAITNWLSQKFSRANDVRHASADLDSGLIFQNHHADIVVQTWMGARIYLYVITEEKRVRDIRHILKNNTRDSVGTLFVLDSHLLPPDGATLKLDDWLVNLQALSDGGIYAYRIQDNTASLMRVNFNETGILGEYFCWHSLDFGIESVATRRREIAHDLKGIWLLADIASPSYKRRINYERINQRHHYRTREVRDTHVQLDNEKFVAYCAILNVTPSSSEQEVKQAYRQLALRVHPDVSALPHFEAEKRFKALQEAYDYIKQHHGWH